MMQFSVQAEIEESIKKLQSIAEAKQLNFAVARALTQTALDLQAEVRVNMPRRFTIRKQWTINGIRITPATKQKLEATVYSKDDYMGLQEYGGVKSPTKKQYLAVPLSMVRRTSKDSIRRSDLPKNLGDKVSKVEINGKFYLALKRGRMGANGQKLRLLYALIPAGKIKKRLGLETDGDRIARAAFKSRLNQFMIEAMMSAR